MTIDHYGNRTIIDVLFLNVPFFRTKVKELVERIRQFTNVGNEKAFLYEVIVAELVLHKGADINQMTQTSGNPDVQAQCNHHDMLKVDYLVQPLAQTMAPNPTLWKDFNDSVRLLFRGQAFPENCKYID